MPSVVFRAALCRAVPPEEMPTCDLTILQVAGAAVLLQQNLDAVHRCCDN